MKLFLLPLFCMLASTFAAHDLIKDDAFVKNYLAELKKNYDKRVAPEGNSGPGSSIRVTCSMWILDVSEVDDSNMDFTATFYIRQAWSDRRVRYTAKNGSVMIFNSIDDFWSPDLFFTSSREGKLHQLVHPNVMVRITPDGGIFYSVRLTVKIPCAMDLSSFPHDIHKCRMTIESYAFQKHIVEVEWIKNPLGYNENITLHNFYIKNCSESEYTEHLTVGDYKVLTVDFIFGRKFGFFAVKLYVPFVILVIVSMLSLWIKAEDRGIRLSLLVIILYVMINVSSEVSSAIPPAPYTKGSDVWIGFCESLVFAIFLEFVAVALISGRHDNGDLESKGEILLDMESDTKEQSLKSDTLKSHLYKLVNMFDARHGGKGKTNPTAYRIDKIFRIVFPLVFILFNIVYWSVYCCKSMN